MRNKQSKLARILHGIVETEPIFHGYCGIERELVPVRQRVTRFESEAALESISGEMFDLVLDTHGETRRQTHLDFLPEDVSR